MTIQLIGKDDSSFEDSEVLSGRWQAYIDSYVSVRICSPPVIGAFFINVDSGRKHGDYSPNESKATISAAVSLRCPVRRNHV